MSESRNKSIYLYLQLTLVFSTVFWSLTVWSGHLTMGFGLAIPAIMWCPGLAALMTCSLLRRDFSGLAWHWPEKKYFIAAYFLPLIYTSLAYGTIWATQLGGFNLEFASVVAQSFGLQRFPAWAAVALYVIFMGTSGMIQNISMALGEEIGWRGFLVPELAKQMCFTKVSIVSGIAWACWHVPLLLVGDYGPGTNRWYALGCSSVTVLSVGCILAWLRLKSHSLWPGALLHASHNLFVAGIFDNLTRNTGSTLWYTTEFGAALAITTTIAALYFWRRRAEVQESRPQQVSAEGPSLTASRDRWRSIGSASH